LSCNVADDGGWSSQKGNEGSEDASQERGGIDQRQEERNCVMKSSLTQAVGLDRNLKSGGVGVVAAVGIGEIWRAVTKKELLGPR
jgi:hypothetical protein